MDKCSINDGKIILCKELEFLFSNYDSKIEKVILIEQDTMENFIGAVHFRYGLKNKDIVRISFCPICGGNLVEEV